MTWNKCNVLNTDKNNESSPTILCIKATIKITTQNATKETTQRIAEMWTWKQHKTKNLQTRRMTTVVQLLCNSLCAKPPVNGAIVMQSVQLLCNSLCAKPPVNGASNAIIFDMTTYACNVWRSVKITQSPASQMRHRKCTTDLTQDVCKMESHCSVTATTNK